jgi:hypothetical protein
VLLANTEALVAYWHAWGVDPTPTWSPPRAAATTPTSPRRTPLVQIPMVSKATGISPSTLAALIKKETHGAELGFLGSSYIDVLQLNEALAKLQ